MTGQQMMEAHGQDVAMQDSEQVHFKHWWADPMSGKVFCLSEGPDMDAVKRVHERAGHPANEIYELALSGS